MISVSTVSVMGLSTRRQVDALYSSPTHFSPEAKRKAALSTGISVEYALQSTSADGPADDDERVLLIMGFQTPKEAWAPTIDHLLEKWSAPEGKNLMIASLDNRGVGGSDAPWWRYTTSQMAADALALMDYLGWDSAHIVGILTVKQVFRD